MRIWLWIVFVLAGCGDKSDTDSGETSPRYEGQNPGECSDLADNDRDGLFDCDDPDCAESLDCDEVVDADADDGSDVDDGADADDGADSDSDSDSDADSDAGADTGDTGDVGPVSEFGLDSRPPNLSCVAPERPASAGSISLEPVFEGLDAAAPVTLLQAPDEPDWWYVVQQSGEVYRFDNADTVTDKHLFLDVSDRVSTGFELGLLGMAFHPNFAENGFVYVHYTTWDGGQLSRLSRFTAADDGRSVVASSEVTILEVEQPFDNHNGGQLGFGPDGYLYWGLGDGGSAGDPYGYGQSIDSLLGSIVRIDVDGAFPYAIPPDNPFVGESAGALEIYAWGFRNPWAFSFDSVTGDLWVGDVGQYSWEGIDLVMRGGNYGWNIKEGTACFSVPMCDMGWLIDPVVEYPNPGGASVVMGPAYRGSAMPELVGTVLYTDFYTGEITGISWDPLTGEPVQDSLVTASGHYLSALVQGLDGEVYASSYYGNTIFKLVAGSPAGSSTFPDRLSDSGCTQPYDPTTPSHGLIPYTVNARFWSDGAKKQRWFAIPDDTQISVEPDGDLDFPVGSVIVKEFEKDGVVLETRLMVRPDDGEWAGYSYVWNEGHTDAIYARGGTLIDLEDGHWEVPSTAQCLQCHTDVAGRTLGLELQQLDRVMDYPSGVAAEQLATLEHIGIFESELPSEVSALPSPIDATASVAERARAVLHTNCAGCHQPGGTGGGALDFRYTTPLSEMGACDVFAETGDMGIASAKVIAPGAADLSVLLLRMQSTDVYRMPPLGTHEVDTAGTALVESWINDLTSCL